MDFLELNNYMYKGLDDIIEDIKFRFKIFNIIQTMGSNSLNKEFEIRLFKNDVAVINVGAAASFNVSGEKCFYFSLKSNGNKEVEKKFFFNYEYQELDEKEASRHNDKIKEEIDKIKMQMINYISNEVMY